MRKPFLVLAAFWLLSFCVVARAGVTMSAQVDGTKGTMKIVDSNHYNWDVVFDVPPKDIYNHATYSQDVTIEICTAFGVKVVTVGTYYANGSYLSVTGSPSVGNYFHIIARKYTNSPFTLISQNISNPFNITTVVDPATGVGAAPPGAPQTAATTFQNGQVYTSGTPYYGTVTGRGDSTCRYRAYMVSGDGIIYMDQGTGDFTYMPGGGGTVKQEFIVYIDSAPGWEQSPRILITGSRVQGQKISFTIPANASHWPMTYRLVQAGANCQVSNSAGGALGTLTDMVWPPGAPAATYTFFIDGSLGPVSLEKLIVGLDSKNGTWFEMPGVVTNLGSMPLTITDELSSAPSNVMPVSKLPSSAAPSATAGEGPIWTPPSTVSPGDLLTNEVFREGVSKIMGAGAAGGGTADALTNAVFTSGELATANTVAAGNAAAAVAATTAHNDTTTLGGIMQLAVDTIKAFTVGSDADRAAVKAAIDANPTDVQKNTARTNAEADVTRLIPSLSAAPGGSSNTGAKNPSFTAPDLTYTDSFTGKTFDLNPFRADRLGPVVDWFRFATYWAVLAGFAFWAGSQVNEWVRGFSTVRQATGNAVVGGTGAQATALLSAGIITVAFAVGVTALVGWLVGDFSLSSLLNAITTNPVGNIGAKVVGALWMVDQMFPMSTIITALIMRVTWQFYAARVFGLAAVTVRWCIA